MHVLYWAQIAFAKPQLIAALSVLPVRLTVAQSFEEVLRHLPDCDMVVSVDCPQEHAVALAHGLAGSPVKWFQFLSAGRERLVKAGLPPGLKLFGPEDAIAPAVAEHAFALALALYRGIPRAVRNHAWNHDIVPHMRALEGDTALIIGLGAIGRDVARRAKAFGMHVLAATRTPKPNEYCDSVDALDTLDELLPQAGVVFATVALAPETHHILGARQFTLMRNDAFLINVGRGGLLDQHALAAALANGQIAGAGLDVADPEPLPDDDPLWRAPNLLVTPHVAAMGSWRSQERLAAVVSRNVSSILHQEQAG